MTNFVSKRMILNNFANLSEFETRLENEIYAESFMRFSQIQMLLSNKTMGEKIILTLALASTLAPFLRRILMMSVWLARAARWRGVSPRTVASSGLAWMEDVEMDENHRERYLT